MNSRLAQKPDPSRTLWENDAGMPVTIDQTLLPFEYREITLTDIEHCATAIETMQVRGAPLIGAVGAWGMALSLQTDSSDRNFEYCFDRLLKTRPTAVNLRWALERMHRTIKPLPAPQRAVAAITLARTICDEDIQCNHQIGVHGADLLRSLIADRPKNRPLQILTHCNAGRLATIGYGTATAPIYRLAEEKIPLHVWVGETRPRNQGANLTAWELADAGINHTVIADNAGGLLMMRGEVDVVLLGADRVTHNGDVVNKIGTYLKALAANAHAIPFYVACPTSTIDLRCARGADVPIEHRDAEEVTHMAGRLPDGKTTRVLITPPGSAAANPAFDITPAALVTQLITEQGGCAASDAGVDGLGLGLMHEAIQ